VVSFDDERPVRVFRDFEEGLTVSQTNPALCERKVDFELRLRVESHLRAVTEREGETLARRRLVVTRISQGQRVE